MNRYHVVIMGREAPELLTREGYASKGEARRAWSTAARGAVLLEDGVAIDEKTGTSKTVAAALRRFAAKLKLDDTDERADELDEQVVPEVDDEEPDEPPPPPVRASKVRAGRCPSCDEVLPDHLSSCPTLPAVMPEPPAKGFEFDDQPDLSGAVEVPAGVRPVSGDTIERNTLVMVDEPPAKCVAKGCDASTGEIRTTTPREFTCLCPGHRQVARFVMRDHDLDRAGAVEWLRANVRKAHIRAERAQKPPPRVAVSKVKAEAAPLTINELVEAAATVLDASAREVELVVGRSVVEVLVDDKMMVEIRHDGSADPVKLISAALAEKCGDLVELRKSVVSSVERDLTRARARQADAVALMERLRAAGAL